MKKALPIIYILIAALLLVPLINGIIDIIKLMKDDISQPAYIFGYTLVYILQFFLICFLVIKGIGLIVRYRRED